MIFIIIAIFVCLALGYGFFIEPNILDIEKIIIAKEKNFPAGLNGKKFVLISDLHFTHRTKKNWIFKIAGAIKKLNPDIIFIAGDLVATRGGVVCVVNLTKEIVKICPTYIVFGNWDYLVMIDKIGEFKKDLENTGASVLINEEKNIIYGDNKLNIVGIKDPYTTKNDTINLDQNSNSKDSYTYKILLTHSPDVIFDAIAKKFDLVLAGHTHGGQVYIPFITKFMIPVRKEIRKYAEGYFKINDTEVYVNRGIGQSTLPFRFLTPPEITLLTIKK